MQTNYGYTTDKIETKYGRNTETIWGQVHEVRTQRDTIRKQYGQHTDNMFSTEVRQTTYGQLADKTRTTHGQHTIKIRKEYGETGGQHTDNIQTTYS